LSQKKALTTRRKITEPVNWTSAKYWYIRLKKNKQTEIQNAQYYNLTQVQIQLQVNQKVSDLFLPTHIIKK